MALNKKFSIKTGVNPSSRLVWPLFFVFLFAHLARGADEPAFKSPAAAQATLRYKNSVAAASKLLTDELDRSLKYAVQAGALDEANQINEAKKLASAGEAVNVDFKRTNLLSARNRYRDSLLAAKSQYYRDLEAALRVVTRQGDLQEANAIDAVRKTLESNLAGGKITGKIENGLWLSIGDKRTVWENKPITLPSNKTQVSLEGALLLSGKARTVKLRTAQAGGSERLKFTVDGKQYDFQMEGSHRYVVVTPQPGSDRMRLLLSDSVAANEWLFGPLEWAINEGSWREIPVRSMVAVE